jgi:hypothetical protein
LKREKEDLKELQTFLVTPDEVEKERETVVSCRNEIRRLETKLRLLGQRYTMLKVAVDAACRRYVDSSSGAGGRESAVGGVGSPVAALQLSEKEAGAATSAQKRKGKLGKGRGRKQGTARDSARDDDAAALDDTTAAAATAAGAAEDGADGGTAAWRRALSANAEAQLAGLADAGQSPKALIDALCDRVDELRREMRRSVEDYSLRALQVRDGASGESGGRTPHTRLRPPAAQQVPAGPFCRGTGGRPSRRRHRWNHRRCLRRRCCCRQQWWRRQWRRGGCAGRG